LEWFHAGDETLYSEIVKHTDVTWNKEELILG